MTSLIMLVPSRGRPGNVAELADAWAETTTGDSRLMVVADLDDPLLPGYQDLPGSVDLHTQHGAAGLGPILNAVARDWAPRGPYIGFMGDDHRPRTKGWDQALTAALEDAPGVAYGDDLFQGEHLPTACVITSSLITKLGYMCPPGIRHLYLDDFWKTLGQAAGNLAYRPDVVIEHLHPAAGKAAWDPGYEACNSPERYAADSALWHTFLKYTWPLDAARVKP